MIVDKMTYAQVAREIDRTDTRCDLWIDHNRNKIRKTLEGKKDGIAVFNLPVGAERPNLVLVCKTIDKKRFTHNFFIWKETPSGKHFYSTSECLHFKIYDEYTAHYMARYIERWNLKCTPMQAMVGITINLINYGLAFLETGNAPTEKLNLKVEGRIVYKRTIDGISVVDRMNNFFVHKTFLQWGMGFEQEDPVINQVTNLFLEHMDDNRFGTPEHCLGYHEFDLHGPDVFELKR